MTDKPKEKPPLGIMPELLWHETRMWELIAALERHQSLNAPYPVEWLLELSIRSAEIHKRIKLE